MKPDIDAVLAFDTSNYTTSVAVMDLAGNLLDHRRQLLSVEDGKRGLRQSDALFQHIQRLPVLMEALSPTFKRVNLKAVGYSDRPRRVEGSYMPVFLAGETLARSLSASHGIPCVAFSHQEGHIAAGLWSLGLETDQPFYAFHLSGGTTELLQVTSRGSAGEVGFDESIVGATSDISLGQLIDRTGVAMGLAFPAGPALEKLALAAEEAFEVPFDIPFSIKTNHPSPTPREGGVHQPILGLSLSGPETHLQRLLTSETPERIAFSLFHFSGKVLARLLMKAQAEAPLPMVLNVGGVASNTIVRRIMEEEVGKAIRKQKRLAPITLHYALPAYCSDHAVGTAVLTVQAMNPSS